MAFLKGHERGTVSNASTSFLVTNLHCHSCVSVIRSTLAETCGDDAIWISPNVVTSIVTVEHRDTARASVRTMAKSLSEAGFEVSDVWTSATIDTTPEEPLHSLNPDPLLSIGRLRKTVTGLSIKKQTIHMENCDTCRVSQCATFSGFGLKEEPACSERPEPERLDLERVAEASSTEPLWRATLSVGGMTCAACVNTITEDVSQKPWVDKIVVNLVSNSATVDLYDKSQAETVAECIRDLGYDVTLNGVVRLEKVQQKQQKLKQPGRDQRELEIKIDGIFCSHCPDRVAETLKWLSNHYVEILSSPSHQTPILKISYHPSPPNFTIRHVLAAIEATDPSFHASVYRPPTIEERSRAIRARHQRELLRRVVLTVAAAIPAFVLGIVYMDLVPASNSSRQLLTAPWASGVSRLELALFILATPVYFFAADIFHVRAYKEMRAMWRRGSPTPLLRRFYRFGSMNMLMSLGTTIAYLSSVGQMIATAVAGTGAMGQMQDVKNTYFDSVVFLTLFLLVGKIIESYSKSKTGDAVELLGRLRPNTAILVERQVSIVDRAAKSADDEKKGDQSSVVAADVLEVGDLVRVLNGASPPADGTVAEGETNFDESSLTGESKPVHKVAGDEVFTGTVNKGAPVLVNVTGIGGSSMLDQIVDAVREGQTKRAPMERIADVLTAYFAPLVTLVAVVTWIIWLALALSGVVPASQLSSGDGKGGGAVVFALQFAIAVFVVACPCGLGLAAPTAIFVGGGIAAQHGILAKGGGEAFEKASRVDCVVFDKTGTLTTGGEPRVIDAILLLDGENHGQERDLGRDGGQKIDPRHFKFLNALKTVEESSSHPMAKAVVAHCSSMVPQLPLDVEVTDVQEQAGRGMWAKCRVRTTGVEFELVCGNERMMAEHSVAVSAHVSDLLTTWKADAKSVVLAAMRPVSQSDSDQQDGQTADAAWELTAAMSISDPVRPEAAAVISELQRRGVSVWMLSGDNVATAEAVAARLGINANNVMAGVLPSGKAEQIRQLQAAERSASGRGRATVAMVGDGINDSPALAAADIGVAVGSGSDVAISSADFVLLSSDLRSVLTLLGLSRSVFGRVRLNFAWAICYNIVAIPFAAGALYAVHNASGQPIRLDPVWAALAMALSSISVVLSSLALRLRIPGIGFCAPRL